MATQSDHPPPLESSPPPPPPATTTQSKPPPPAAAISLRAPSPFSTTSLSSSSPPPLEWLERTWTVTHSTLPMWRKAKNVRITYKILPPAKEGDPPRLDDLVESVPTQRTLLPQPKQVRGIDTAIVSADADGAGQEKVIVGWNWRGKGLLRIASSHWEVLGWGERPLSGGDGEGEVERWAVTWFESTLFTPQGVDVYSDRKGGISEGLFADLERALERVEEGGVGALCKGEMRAVVIDDS